MEWLSGKKTYAMAALGGIVTALHLAGLIDGEQLTAALGFLGFGTAASLRAGVAKSGPSA